MEVLINQGVFRIYHAGNEEEKKKKSTTAYD